jgi:hypothetical protein
LRGGEGLEVACVGVADADVGGGAGVARVGGGVLSREMSDGFRGGGDRVVWDDGQTWMPSGRGIALLQSAFTVDGWLPDVMPFSGSQMASGAQTMPAVASSTTTSLSFPQLMRSVLSQTKIPLEPVRCAASHDVCPLVRGLLTC